jgi:diguanylate cyclase (GGDEF)-like protein/PAS domain S-box-containing protein
MWGASSMMAQIFWLNATYCGVVYVPTTFFIFVLRLAHLDHWVTRRNLLLLAVEPIATFLIVWTNEFHHLFHASFRMDLSGSFALLDWERGIWFWFNVAYSYILNILGVILLLRAIRRSYGPYRSQLVVVTLGALIPWAASIYTQGGFSTIPELDLTPISFTLSGLVIAYALFRYRLLDLVPVARSTLVERMSEGVLVLDNQGRVVDINPTAGQILNVAPADALGKAGKALFTAWPELVQKYGQQREARAEVTFGDSGEVVYDLSILSVVDARERVGGRLITFRDISERKRAEKEMEAANKRLQEQLAEIKSLQAQLQEQAIRDPLTGLYNRRYFDETLEREIARARRGNYSLSLVTLDIDHFKNVNDTYGHEAGDLVLQNLSSLLVALTRQSDIACRFGGEEFLWLLIRAPVEAAERRAEALRVLFADLRTPYGEIPIRGTISLGVACFPDHAGGGRDLVNASDRALYAAKAAGRNCVRLAQSAA